MAATKRTAKRKTAQTKSRNGQFWSVILFAAGILILLLSLIKGDEKSAWLYIHNFLLGLFGPSVFIIPVVLVYVAFMFSFDKSGKAAAGKMIQGAGLIVIISAFVQIIFFGTVDGSDFLDKLVNLYKNGVNYKSGGLFSAVIGWPLLALFKKNGASIIISILLFVFAMLVANLTILDFFKLFYKPIKKAKEAVDKTKEEDFKFIANEPSSIKSIAEKNKSNFKVDIPIGVPENKELSKPKETEKKSEGTPKTKKAKLEESVKDLDEIIKKAAPVSKASNSSTVESNERVEIQEGTEKKTDRTEKIKETTDKIAKEIDEEIKEENLKSEQEQRSSYKLPPLELLNEPKAVIGNEDLQIELKQKADTLVDTLKSFGVQTRIVDINRGPTVTRYELQPAVGVKISKITGLSDDIALSLAATGVRIEAPIPGKAAVGIEIPNVKRDVVSMRELLDSNEYKNCKSKISFVVGKNIEGKIITGDIAKMPHMLIAGTTGSGKSVFTNSIIVSILYKATPDEVRIILIDPKMVEFNKYNGIPHLLIPVILDPRKAAGALNWAVSEMTKRYKLFADSGVRDLEDYNETARETGKMEPLPQIVIIIDELADLMMAAPNEVEDSICRLAQLARAAGMHVIIATQRPSVDVVTGLIKANFPSRVALTVSSQFDSRTIIDSSGAEKLLGNGDMLYYPSGIPKPIRVQGAFVTNKEIQSIISFIKDEVRAEYDEKVMEEIENNTPSENTGNSSKQASGHTESSDEMVDRAIDIIIESGQASTSYLQRRLKLGYARAARIIDEIEEMGIIGPFEGSKPRQVLMSKDQWYERKLQVNNEK